MDDRSTRACRIAGMLERYEEKTFRATIGFDGYIDELLRVVEKGDNRNGYAFYRDISSFAARLAKAAGKSADLEIVPTDVKIGGNAPIMANALSRLGVDSTCIGAMGAPELEHVFREMAEKCRCISLCAPAYTHALEFDDGKVMLANTQSLEQLTWGTVRDRLGLETLTHLLGTADYIALVNWSGVSGAADIWSGILEEVLPATGGKLSGEEMLPAGDTKDRRFFFDLADPSKKSAEEIRAVLQLIHAYSAYGKVTLGLNENEALCVHSAIGGRGTDLEGIGREIYEKLAIDAVVIHPIDRCIAVTADSIMTEQGCVVPVPKISTGGGDNFNAGFCLGQLLGLGLREAMLLGMAVSGFYVENGRSPSRHELAEHLLKL